MAPRKGVTSLTDLCLQRIQSLVFDLVIGYADQEEGPIEESALGEAIRNFIIKLPYNTHDRFMDLYPAHFGEFFVWAQGSYCDLELYLTSYIRNKVPDTEPGAPGPKYFDYRENNWKAVNLLNYLMSLLTLLKIRTINVVEIERQLPTPPHVWKTLVELTGQITSLETFILHHYLKPSRMDIFKNNIKSLSNLTNFAQVGGCSDEILALLNENCKLISRVDVSWSKYVSNNCIEHLVKFEKLQSLNLHGTKVRADGFFKLLTQSKSLTDVTGLHKYLNEILDRMESSTVSSPIPQFRQLRYADVEPNRLNLVARYFPNLIGISLRFINIVNPDLFDFSSLFSIKSLKKVALQFECENLDQIRQIVRKCPLVTALTLQQGFKSNVLDLRSLHDILTSCPLLEKLAVKQNIEREFADFIPRFQLSANPFQKLTTLIWTNDLTVSVAEYILRHAVNIEVIQFYIRWKWNSNTDERVKLTDRFFESILEENPLKELRSLRVAFYDRDLVSAALFKRIISSCEKLCTLTITWDTSVLDDLQNFINENNYDVQLDY